VQAGLALALLADFKNFGRTGQKLIAPLIDTRVVNLMLGVKLGHRLALQALNDEHRFGLASHVHLCMANLPGCQPQCTLFRGPLS
jgi:hypothetical protein